MKVNKHGHAYKRGKAISDEVRSMIMDEIVKNGGNTTTGFIPGSLECIAKKFRLKIDTVKKVRKRFYTTGELKRPKTVSSGVKHLQPEDIEFIEVLKTNRPSMTTGKLLWNVKDYCDLPIGTSKPAINQAVRNHMRQGKWSRKRMVRPSAEKFIPANRI